ncbi:hypothetical protein [Akkermansia glycaniphila]|uniref:hypothetical protein n=1 Tax=Akkermansia glycaniphila TaxID=1679444 RepID=UPI001C404BDD|nr:hypothetical protein [Akkermansia glycaniphila]
MIRCFCHISRCVLPHEDGILPGIFRFGKMMPQDRLKSRIILHKNVDSMGASPYTARMRTIFPISLGLALFACAASAQETTPSADKSSVPAAVVQPASEESKTDAAMKKLIALQQGVNDLLEDIKDKASADAAAESLVKSKQEMKAIVDGMPKELTEEENVHVEQVYTPRVDELAAEYAKLVAELKTKNFYDSEALTKALNQ